MESLRERTIAIASALTGFAAERLDPDVPLVELGFDSLVLTQMAQRLRTEFGVGFAYRDFLTTTRTLNAVTSRVAEAQPASTDAVRRPDDLSATATRGGVAQAGARLEGAAPQVGSVDAITSILKGQLDLLERQLDMLAGAGGQTAAVAVPLPTDAPPRREPDPVQPTEPVSSYTETLTPHQEAHLRRLVTEWTERTPGSRALTDQYRPVHADPRTVAGFHPAWKDIVYPLVVNRSEGPLLWDVDGNRYVDLLNGFGPSFFGHSPPFVVEALRAQLEAGFEIGPQTPLAGETAELICKLTGLDRATFTCTGSEAVQAALRAARTYTGRDQVAVFAKAYHGNFDEVLVRGVHGPAGHSTLPASPGVPSSAVENMVVLEYGSDESLETIRRLAPRLAAVLVEPVQTRQPELQPAAFLKELRRITKEHGTVLIFDEVVTGFRCHVGGAQAVFDVDADLVTFGKVLGGGLPIGVLAGRRPFIDVLDGGPWRYGDESGPTQGVMFFAGTFVRHPLAIAGCHATLRYLERAGPTLQEELNERMTNMASQLNRIAEERRAPVEIPHFSSFMFLRPKNPRNRFNSIFFHLMRTHGVHVPEGFPSYLTLAHTDDHIREIVTAFEESVRAMQEMDLWEGRRTTGRPPVSVAGTASDPDRPPAPGARLGRDEHGAAAWFVEDPDEPGSYIRID